MRTFIVSGIILIFIGIQLLQQGRALRTIDGDGSGYYAYLVATLIYKTTDFTPVFEAEKARRSLDYTGHYFHQVGNKMANKYFLGTAVLMFPFFMLALFYSFITGMPIDGYNILFQYAISLGAAFYLAIGILASIRFLTLFNIDKKHSIRAALMLLLGTNLFFYAFLHPSHSHVYSFAAIAVFLLFSRSYFLFGNNKDFYFAAIAFGIITLIRPTNALILFSLPFVAGNIDTAKSAFQNIVSKRKTLVIGALISLLILALQPLYNLIQTGQLNLWSYRNEGFNFGQPAILSFLFSYRKGLFVYTPFLLLLFPAIIFMYKQSKYLFFTLTLFVLLLIYVLSSWWNWYFGDSFGMRAMIEFYPLIIVPVAMFISWLMKRLFGKILLAAFVISTIALNLLQTYQYKHAIIHPDSMTKEKYWHVFLKTDAQYRNIFGGSPEPIFADLDENSAEQYLNRMEQHSNFWTSNGIQESEHAYSGKFLAELSQSNIYSPTLVLMGENLKHTKNDIYVTVRLMYRELEINSALEALLVYAATGKDNELSFYKTFRLKQMPDNIINDWRHATFGFVAPAWDTDLLQIKVYVWNTQKTQFQIDDFEVNKQTTQKK